MRAGHCPKCDKKCEVSRIKKYEKLPGEKLPELVEVLSISCHKCGFINQSIKRL